MLSILSSDFLLTPNLRKLTCCPPSRGTLSIYRVREKHRYFQRDDVDNLDLYSIHFPQTKNAFLAHCRRNPCYLPYFRSHLHLFPRRILASYRDFYNI